MVPPVCPLAVTSYYTEIGGLPRRRKPECHSFADAEPSRGMRIELRAEGIFEHDCSQLGWLDNQEHAIRKHPS